MTYIPGNKKSVNAPTKIGSRKETKLVNDNAVRTQASEGSRDFNRNGKDRGGDRNRSNGKNQRERNGGNARPNRGSSVQNVKRVNNQNENKENGRFMNYELCLFYC